MTVRAPRLVVLGLAVVAVAGSASSAFALRNRYTDEPIPGFTGLLFGDYGVLGLGDERGGPYRPYRGAYREGPVGYGGYGGPVDVPPPRYGY